MSVIEDYIDEYIDRNMEYIIAEWEVSTKRDIRDFEKRIADLEMEARPIGEFNTYASEKVTELEHRLQKIKEGL
jgi:polyhydroxyalkanoate synthesis regulator phasin